MKFTKEQFNALGKFYTDDLNINDADQDFMFEVFNELPQNLQAKAVEWGFSESLTRESIFEYLVEKLYNVSIHEYYDKELYNADTMNNKDVLTKLRNNK